MKSSLLLRKLVGNQESGTPGCFSPNSVFYPPQSWSQYKIMPVKITVIPWNLHLCSSTSLSTSLSYPARDQWRKNILPLHTRCSGNQQWMSSGFPTSPQAPQSWLQWYQYIFTSINWQKPSSDEFSSSAPQSGVQPGVPKQCHFHISKPQYGLSHCSKAIPGTCDPRLVWYPIPQSSSSSLNAIKRDTPL